MEPAFQKQETLPRGLSWQGPCRIFNKRLTKIVLFRLFTPLELPNTHVEKKTIVKSIDKKAQVFTVSQAFPGPLSN